MRPLRERDATSTDSHEQSPCHLARKRSFAQALGKTCSNQGILQSGISTGEGTASSGTMRETLPHSSTLKGIKWTHFKWSLSKQPSPRLEYVSELFDPKFR